MPRFRKISDFSIEIEAEQFVPPLRIPKGVFNVYGAPNGENYSGQIWNNLGERVGVKPTDYIVYSDYNPDRHYSMSQHYLEANFEPISG